MTTLRIGSGAGYSGDRIEPAVELAEKGGISYLVFECLAERTIAIAQQARLADPEAGFDPLLVDRMRAVLPACRKNGIRIVSNMGAANPEAAARAVLGVAEELGLGGLRVAAVSGDEIRAALVAGGHPLSETGRPAAELGEALVSANAYLGAGPIVEALEAGADVVLTGRVADPSLFLAPMIHEFGWAMDDWERLGRGTILGHLLECAGQVTGGYFADPGIKDVPGLARLGFPIAEIDPDGNGTITKVDGSGGTVTTATVKEQLLYEVHDPAAYLTPDVTADFTGLRVTREGPDRVRIEGGTGRERPATLKASVGYAAGWRGEGQISYAGPNARARAELAREIVRERFALIGLEAEELRFDLMGIDSILAGMSPPGEPAEVRLRVAGRCASAAEAKRIGNEVEALYTNGPASGGGATKSTGRIIAMLSALVPRAAASPRMTMVTR
ncbi:acyclic terpene utilization AtuA family protein [Mangrovicoccus sp. HB161399]|uniref:acyclic terpene utilization AtuA family protein n=1 Tax=Mangrovicoccus sp. HB161399 TaxID=2720392 RepID=UPI00155655F4|nr:acyclic terpene utilization AtuA family protein [Mangrovicoccus sp. HB161399]